MTDATAADPGPTVIRIAGPSDSGKTSLVERLVEALSEELTVGTVKSIHHDIEPDTPGSDTHRHRTAGARSVVGITPEHAFEIAPLPRPTNEGTREDRVDIPGGASEADRRKRTALAATLDRYAERDYDLVLVEGFSGLDVPTVWLGDDEDPVDDGGDSGEHGDDPVGDVLATDETPFDELVARIRGLVAA